MGNIFQRIQVNCSSGSISIFIRRTREFDDKANFKMSLSAVFDISYRCNVAWRCLGRGTKWELGMSMQGQDKSGIKKIKLVPPKSNYLPFTRMFWNIVCAALMFFWNLQKCHVFLWPVNSFGPVWPVFILRRLSRDGSHSPMFRLISESPDPALTNQMQASLKCDLWEAEI